MHFWWYHRHPPDLYRTYDAGQSERCQRGLEWADLIQTSLLIGAAKWTEKAVPNKLGVGSVMQGK